MRASLASSDRGDTVLETLLNAFPLPSLSTEKLRLGIIGAGGFASQAHLPALSLLKALGWPIDIVAICDQKFERLSKAQSLFPGAAYFEDSTALLESKLVNGVILATPPSVSQMLARNIIQWGLPLFVEKPAAESVDVLTELAVTANELKRYVQVGYNRRFQLGAGLLRESIVASPPEFVIARMWRANRNEPAFYSETVVHMLDLLLWLLGPLEVIWAHSWPPRRTGDLEAGWEARLRSSRGVTVTLDVRPAVGRGLESVEILAPESAASLSYCGPDGSDDPGMFSIYREGARQLHYVVDPHSHRDAALLARGFVHQAATFCSLFAQPAASSPCNLDEAVACFILRDQIAAALRTVN